MLQWSFPSATLHRTLWALMSPPRNAGYRLVTCQCQMLLPIHCEPSKPMSIQLRDNRSIGTTLRSCHLFQSNPRSQRTLRLHRSKNQPGPKHERSEEHTSELQSLMRISYAVFCLKKKTNTKGHKTTERTSTH